MGSHYLTPLFSPASVAVIGASDRTGSVGARVLQNLQEAGFHGELFPVNPKHRIAGGLSCYPSIEAVGRPVDLAVIATPAATVPGILSQCGEAGVRTAIVISAGFAEAGDDGKRLQETALQIARKHAIRFLGPNCLGLIRPQIGLNATFSKTGARPGEVALVSQSGALCTAILDWADNQGIGFSAVVSVGDAADLDFGQLFDYLALDRHTRSILVYVEGVHQPRTFMSGLRIAARLKPVIVMKSGRHSAGARAAVSHSAALVGADNVFSAALDRAGVVRAKTISELFSAARILSSGIATAGNSLAIVTNAGGAGVIAADAAAEHGVKLAELSPSTIEFLDAGLPAQWSHANPVDVLGDADTERYRLAVEACGQDEAVDALVVVLTPQGMTDPSAVARAVVEIRPRIHKPLLVCWMGGTNVAEAAGIFTEAGIPSFRTPEAAVAAFAQLARYRRNQQLLLQVPGPLSDRTPPSTDAARQVVRNALDSGRTILTETEAKRILEAFHIPTVRTVEVENVDDAVRAAEEIGFPVALKISSPDITHKSDAGGVELNLYTAERVRDRYTALLQRIHKAFPDAAVRGVSVQAMYKSQHSRELIAGVVSDPVFGPVVSFGAGGVTVEVFKDQAIAIPPLNEVLVEAMISKTRVARLLGSFRDMPPVNREALIGVLLRISEMVCEIPEIAEMDINPLVADADGVVALDARVRLAPSQPAFGRYGHMTIHPYPHQLEKTVDVFTGEKVFIRPIRPEDAAIEQSFVRRLSDDSKYFRFMNALHELTPKMLVRFTQIDYDREMAFIATTTRATEEIEIGVARYTINPDNTSCEFAIVVADEWRGKGVATRLMETLMDEARSKGLATIEGEVLSTNRQMLDLAQRMSFENNPCPDDPSVRLVRRQL